MNQNPAPIVIALGGNALVRPGEPATIGTQFDNALAAMRAIAPLVEGRRAVLTHGNGFQVGHMLIRVEQALGKAYALPLEVCVAESQGELGYLLEQALHNALAERGLCRPIVGMLTQVRVAADDPAFAAPTKPVGPCVDAAGAERLRRAGFAVIEEPGRGFRKVVASPRPLAIEEEEEYQPWLDHGFVVFAGFDYRAIVREAERSGDVLIFDGGNNDQPMIEPDAQVVVLDPHRPGHETTFYPGYVNLLCADIAVVNKVDSADPAAVAAVEQAVQRHRPGIPVILARSEISGHQEAVRGRRCVVIGDGPTLTHGGMAFGAGSLFVRQHGGTIVDPRPNLVGSLRDTLARYPHIEGEVPAMGCDSEQLRDLERSLDAVPADVVVDGSPADLGRLLRLDKPIVNLRYELDAASRERLAAALADLGLP